jgi:L-alanine-DL-glutamate epimerase-like enolase superfamily enzyme
MRITDVRAHHARVPSDDGAAFDGSYNAFVVVVETDEGLSGIGEADSLPAALQALIEGPSAHSRAQALGDVLIGKDALDTEGCWQAMYEATLLIGRRGLVMHAIGALDLALWDLRGKAEGLPVSHLLGGALRDRVLAYASIYPLGRSTEEVQRQVERALATNLRAFKFAADRWWLDDLEETGDLLQVARDVAGPEARIIVDGALAYETLEDAARLLPILEAIGVEFFEAPLPVDDLAGHTALAKCGIPIGIGDLGLTHLSEFVELLDAGAGICQPDITCVGGFSAMAQIAAAALDRGKRVVPHAYKTNIQLAANLHFLAAHKDDELLEYSLSESPLRWEMTNEAFPIEDDGTVLVPDAPGLGISLDASTLARYAWPALTLAAQ